MDFLNFAKFLTERKLSLWAMVLTGLTLVVLQIAGYADGLEKGVLTGIFIAAVFALCLLVCMAISSGIEQVQRFRQIRKRAETADATALKVFGDLFDQHRQILQFVATEVGKPNFKAGTERCLLEMLKLELLEVDGPGRLSDSGTYYKVRDVVWKRMVEEGWLERKRWPEDELEPWNESTRF